MRPAGARMNEATIRRQRKVTMTRRRWGIRTTSFTSATISWSRETERPRDIGEGQAENGDAKDPPHPSFDGRDDFRRQGEQARSRSRTADKRRRMLITIRQTTYAFTKARIAMRATESAPILVASKNCRRRQRPQSARVQEPNAPWRTARAGASFATISRDRVARFQPRRRQEPRRAPV